MLSSNLVQMCSVGTSDLLKITLRSAREAKHNFPHYHCHPEATCFQSTGKSVVASCYSDFFLLPLHFNFLPMVPRSFAHIH